MDNFLKVLIGQQHKALYNWDILKHNVWSEFFIFYQRVGGAVNTDDNFFGINSVVLRGSSIIGHNLAGHRDNLRTETNNLYGQRKICGGKTNLCGHKENLRAKNQSLWSQIQFAGNNQSRWAQAGYRYRKLAGHRVNLRGRIQLWGEKHTLGGTFCALYH